MSRGSRVECGRNRVRASDLARDGGATYRVEFPNPHKGTPLRILYAPDHPEFKGAKYLLAAVEELKAEGIPIELVLVQGKSKEEALGGDGPREACDVFYPQAERLFDGAGGDSNHQYKH